MIRLEGKRTVITGAGGGVGTALTAGFAAAGAQVVACDAEGPDLPEGVEQHRFDLTDGDAVDAAAAAIVARGAPGIVVSNAGITKAETMPDVDPPALEWELALNYTGAARLTSALLPSMRADGGAFIFMASVNGLTHHGNPAYSAAKAALLAWMRAIAVEEGRHAIRANAIAPGSVRTPAWDARIAADPEVLDKARGLYPLGRFVTPEEVAQVALFLASPMASGVTGVTMPVDAGLMAGNLPFINAITGGD